MSRVLLSSINYTCDLKGNKIEDKMMMMTIEINIVVGSTMLK